MKIPTSPLNQIPHSMTAPPLTLITLIKITWHSCWRRYLLHSPVCPQTPMLPSPWRKGWRSGVFHWMGMGMLCSQWVTMTMVTSHSKHLEMP
jgi:hypothetical protein